MKNIWYLGLRDLTTKAPYLRGKLTTWMSKLNIFALQKTLLAKEWKQSRGLSVGEELKVNRITFIQWNSTQQQKGTNHDTHQSEVIVRKVH